MRTLLRAVGTTLLLLPAFLIAAPAVTADPDACALLPFGAPFQITSPGNACEAFLSGPSTEITENIFVYIKWHTTAEAARQTIGVPPGSPPSNYGDVGWEGPGATGIYTIEFARGQYQVVVGTGAIVTDARILEAEGYAASIDAAIVAGLVSTPTPSPSSSPSTGTLTTGLACGTDLRVVRCTASPGGAPPDAELVYDWTFDGFTRPETGSTMELDWIAEGVGTGDHTILVTVRDTQHANVSPAVGVTIVQLGLSVRVTCNYELSISQYAVLCTATPVNAFSTAVLSYDWSYSFIDSSGRQRSGVDGSTDERFSRDFGRGAVTVTVVAHDTVNGQQSSPVNYFLAIDATATLTEILTGGETADPQNAIEALTGSAAVAAVVGGLAVLSGVLAGGAGSGAGGAGSAGGGGSPGGAGRPGGAGGPTPPASGGPFADAANMLAAEAGRLPPITAETLQHWKDLSGWPAGADADETFRRTILTLRDLNTSPKVILSVLREHALRVRAGM